jgi:biotin carboxyl carrier protein
VEAALAPGREPGAFDVHVDGCVVPVRIRQSSAFARPRTTVAGAARAGGPQRIVAPMPGKIVRVLVARGDEVAPRQGLVVVEAMKMENELRAPRAGCVQEVAVTEGQSVEAGALLVVVE